MWFGSAGMLAVGRRYLPGTLSRRWGSVLLLLLVGRRLAATLRHRLTAHRAILLIGDRVDLDVVPVGPVDQGLDLGRVGIDALGVDVEVDRDRPVHAPLAPVDV